MSATRPQAPQLLSLLAVGAAVAVAAASCRVDTDAFARRIFHCDTALSDPRCGTDTDGKAMTCYADRQLGGADFCAPTCDQPGPVDGERAVCVQGGAKLAWCDPSMDQRGDGAPGACGQSDLGCLRTDVLTDEGVCVTGTPCVEDKDCRDPVKSTCAATFLRDLYSHAPPGRLHSDHLYCLQERCDEGFAGCSPGETCLIKVLPPGSGAPDICVPNCDSNQQCPPNHFCYQAISGPANPPVCIPGLLGFTCQSDVDCLVGTCMSDRDPDARRGLKLCSIACTRDDDCTVFDSRQGRFVCSDDGRCITPEAYRGANCFRTADCSRDEGTICVRPPPAAPTDLGTCLRPCSATLTCPPRAGIGQSCLPIFVGDDGETTAACFPGYFGSPCLADSQCAVHDLSCIGYDLRDAAHPVPGICTVVCGRDADCQGNRWTGVDSYCRGTSCAPLIEDDEPCDADAHCASRVCADAGGGARACQAREVSP